MEKVASLLCEISFLTKKKHDIIELLDGVHDEMLKLEKLFMHVFINYKITRLNFIKLYLPKIFEEDFLEFLSKVKDRNVSKLYAEKKVLIQSYMMRIVVSVKNKCVVPLKEFKMLYSEVKIALSTNINNIIFKLYVEYT